MGESPKKGEDRKSERGKLRKTMHLVAKQKIGLGQIAFWQEEPKHVFCLENFELKYNTWSHHCIGDMVEWQSNS